MKTENKIRENLVNEINNVYVEKGLNGVYAFLRKNGVKFTTRVVDFGWTTNQKNYEKREQWLAESPLHLPFHNKCTISTFGGYKNRGYRCQILRGIEIILL